MQARSDETRRESRDAEDASRSAVGTDADAPGAAKAEGSRRASRAARRSLYVRVLGLVAVVTVLAIEFRRMFSYGYLIAPDLYGNFPAASSLDSIQIWLEKWNPAHLGNEAASPVGLALLAPLTRAGVLGSALQAVAIAGLTTVGALAIWRLAERMTLRSEPALLAPVLYLLLPNLFTLLFDSNVAFVFYAVLPVIALLTFYLLRTPSFRTAVALGMAIAFPCAFAPFSLAYVVPFLVIMYAGHCVLLFRRRQLLRSGAMLLLATLLALTLNAPYYIGNLPYFTTQGIAGASTANLPLVQASYGWSTPVNLLSLVGSGIFPRYAAFYGPAAQGLLLVPLALASVSLLNVRRRADAPARLSFALLIALSFGWVLLVGTGIPIPLLQAVPYLLVFNYPTVFYLYAGLAYSVLGALAVDDLVHLRAPRPRAAATPDHAALPIRGILSRLAPGGRLGTYIGVGVAIAVVLSVAVPAQFYLGSGDFRVLEAPAAMGFPPQWGATAPPSYQDMYRFIQEHGGDQAGRVLILPFPAPLGSVTLLGYTDNLFNQPEYQASSYTGPFFAVPSSQQYVTTVLDYLIANRTDSVGISLGAASVRYVFVDKTLNFTGPPRWVWDSLVGSPDSFEALLDQQRDLRRVYEDATILVYENEDFEPLVRGYPGVLVVRGGTAGVATNETVYEWAYSRSQWSDILPPTAIASIQNLSAAGDPKPAYLVNASGGGGNLTLQFVTDPGMAGVNASSSRLDNAGFYVTSAPVPVTDDQYAFEYETDYIGPAAHEGGLVFLAGLDSNFTFLWQTATCCAAPPGTSVRQITIAPLTVDPTTAFITATILFPSRFGSGTPMEFRATNLTLNVVSRPPPDVMLAPLFQAKLPADFAPRADGIALWANLDPATISGLEARESTTSFLCLGLCPLDGLPGWDQVLPAYNSLRVVLGTATSKRDNDALAGANLELTGKTEANLSLNGAPFRTLYVRARGAGVLVPALGSSPLAATSVSTTDYRWYRWDLPSSRSDASLGLTTTGNLSLDAFLVTVRLPANVSQAGSGLGVTFRQDSDTRYEGVLPSGTVAVLLSQSHNAGWLLEEGGQTAAPIVADGWANLFILSGTPPAGGTAFTLDFNPETVHLVLVGVQVTALIAAVAFAALPALARLRATWRRFRRR